MPEALAVVAVFVVTVIAWVGAWLHARDPSKHNPREELARLVQQEHWLRDRLVVAQRERWSSDMVATLDAELRQTSAAVRAKSGYSGSNKTVAKKRPTRLKRGRDARPCASADGRAARPYPLRQVRGGVDGYT